MLDAQLPHEATESTQSSAFSQELFSGGDNKLNIELTNSNSTLRDLLPNVSISVPSIESNEICKMKPKLKVKRNIEGEAVSTGHGDERDLPLPDKFDAISPEKKRPDKSKKEGTETTDDQQEKKKFKLKHGPNIIGEAESKDDTIKKWRDNPQSILERAIESEQMKEHCHQDDHRDSGRGSRPELRQRHHQGPYIERDGTRQEGTESGTLRPRDQKPNTIKIRKGF